MHSDVGREDVYRVLKVHIYKHCDCKWVYGRLFCEHRRGLGAMWESWRLPGIDSAEKYLWPLVFGRRGGGIRKKYRDINPQSLIPLFPYNWSMAISLQWTSEIFPGVGQSFLWPNRTKQGHHKSLFHKKERVYLISKSLKRQHSAEVSITHIQNIGVSIFHRIFQMQRKDTSIKCVTESCRGKLTK